MESGTSGPRHEVALRQLGLPPAIKEMLHPAVECAPSVQPFDERVRSQPLSLLMTATPALQTRSDGAVFVAALP